MATRNDALKVARLELAIGALLEQHVPAPMAVTEFTLRQAALTACLADEVAHCLSLHGMRYETLPHEQLVEQVSLFFLGNLVAETIAKLKTLSSGTGIRH